MLPRFLLSVETRHWLAEPTNPGPDLLFITSSSSAGKQQTDSSKKRNFKKELLL